MPVSPVDILRPAEGMALRDEDGSPGTLRLLPPMPEPAIAALEREAGRPLPPQLRTLLSFTRGFEGILGTVEFGGSASGQVLEEAFPHAVPVAQDGYGNCWSFDLAGASAERLDVWFLCHDPPVAVFQTGDLAEFLTELLKLGNPPHRSALDEVREAGAMRVWQENPGLVGAAEARAAATDPALRDFAASLPDGFLICDLRAVRTGDGISWGRAGPNAPLRRHGDLRLFALAAPRPSLWRRLFG